MVGIIICVQKLDLLHYTVRKPVRAKRLSFYTWPVQLQMLQCSCVRAGLEG